MTDKLQNALFMSVTARTAGFNSIDYAGATDSSNFLTILDCSCTLPGIKTIARKTCTASSMAPARNQQTPSVLRACRPRLELRSNAAGM